MLPRIEHPLGSDRDYDFAVLDAQGAPDDVTGSTFTFTVWDELATAPVQLLQLTSESGGIVVDVVVGGIGRLLVRASGLVGKAPGRYRALLERVKPGGHPELLEDIIFILTPAKPAS